jgi:PAS domain S-box-containing protein
MRNQPNEARAQQSERLLQQSWPQLLDNMQEFSAVVDRSGTILYRNRTSATPAVLIGTKIYDAVRPDDRDAMRAALRRALQTGEVQLREVVSRSSGAHYRARLVPIVEDAKVVAVFVGAADISEQKRMEEGLRDSLRAGELHYRALAEAVPDLVFHLDAEGRFLDFLPAPGQELMMPPSEFLGRTASEVLPADLARWVMHHIEQALHTGGTQAFQYRLPVPLLDGDLHDFEARIAPSGANKVVAVVRDVTSTLRTREALEESEAKYRQVFEHVHDVFFWTDMNGVITELSPSTEWWGYDPQDLIGSHVVDFYADPQVRPALQKALLEQGRIVDQHIRLKVPDGRVLDASASFHLLRGPDGAPVGIEGIARDVSERTRAEEALRESERRLRTLVTNAPVVLFAIDPEGVFTVEEGKGLSGLGLMPGQNVGRSVFDVYRDVPEVIDAARRALAGQSFTATVEVGGLTFEAHYGPLRDEHGRVCGGIAVGTDITERKRAEEALRESEGRFRRLSEATIEGIVIHDGDRVLDANSQAAAMLGYDLSELIGADLLALVPADLRDLARKQVLSGHEQSYELRGLRKDGTTFPMEICAKAAFYDGRRVRVGVMRDMSERRRAEQALRESEERFRRLAEGSIDGILLIEGSELRFANTALVQMLGYESDEEVLGRPFTDFVSEDHRELMEERRRARDEGRDVPDRYELRPLRKDGSEFDAEISISTITYRGGWARLGIIRDVTERKQGEQALRESEERFRRLSEATLEGIVVHDAGLILDANLQAAAMLGYELSEIIGKDALGFVAPESRDLVRQHLASGHEDPYEVSLLKKDGTILPTELCGKAAFYRGRPVRMGITRDISERKRAEEAAQKAREDLEARAEQRMEAAARHKLTFRELTVLYLIAVGMADKEIALRLSISPRTASKHVENILNKMNATSRTEAGVRAIKEGLVESLK